MSATWRRVVANQQNATHSTGPKTEAGREISSRNSTKHGLTSRNILITGEDAEELNKLRDSLFEGWRPVTSNEIELFEDLVQQRWRVLRARNAETCFFNDIIEQEMKADPKLTPARAMARAFSNEKYAKRMSLIMRYIREATRDYEKAEAALQSVINLRIRAEASRRAMAHNVASANPAPEFAPVPNGFVSSNGHEPVSAPQQL